MPNLHIIVVDDDLDILDFMEILLELYGYQVHVYATTADVCNQCNHHQPDLIILDLHISIPLAGWHLFHEIRAQATTEGIPVLLYSSDHESLHTYQDQLHAQGCDVLKKPFKSDELFAKIEAVTNT